MSENNTKPDHVLTLLLILITLMPIIALLIGYFNGFETNADKTIDNIISKIFILPLLIFPLAGLLLLIKKSRSKTKK